ncbi:MAG: hypothetical protein NVS2B7_18440 [Herpetosiphon sp.]
MSAITIKDLSLDVELDRKAMASIYGGAGAPWVFGAFQPFVETAPRTSGSIINLFQSNTFQTNTFQTNTFQSNTYYIADRMTNQSLSINGSNNGPVTMVGITG